MPYKTSFHGHEVICDTVEELSALLAPTRRRHASPGHSEKRTPRTVKGWAKSIEGKPRKALEVLASSHPEPLTDDQIKEKLELESNRKIAGIMGSLSKSAKKTGLPFDILIVKEATRNGNGERHYKYGIGPTMIVEVKQGLGLEK